MKVAAKISLIIGVDGASMAHSSSTNAWPIMGYIMGSNIAPFDIGLYVGPTKPRSICDFLQDFGHEADDLQKNGVLVSSERIRKPFDIAFFVTDSPARALLSGTRSHTHDSGCGQCDQKCTRRNRRQFYQNSSGNLRTDLSFAQRSSPEHHADNFKLPNSMLLERLGYRMVSQFPLDPMHLLDQGLAKLILTACVNNSITGIRGGDDGSQLLFRTQFESYDRFTPNDFGRRPRTLTELKRFKATEFRQFILYTGLVLLKSFLDEEAYTHYLLLSVSYRLLSSRILPENLSVVQHCLNEFVRQFTIYYRENALPFNVHSLLHLPGFVELYGPLSNFFCLQIRK